MPVSDTVVDLLVVGSGTGMAAALSAHECGLTVLIVEKSSYVGGSTARSGGALWLPASQILNEKGADDTVERAGTYLQSVVAGTAPDERSTGYLRSVTRTVDAAAHHSRPADVGQGLFGLPPRGAGRHRRRADL